MMNCINGIVATPSLVRTTTRSPVTDVFRRAWLRALSYRPAKLLSAGLT